jgi:hypothetical protein
MVPGGMQVSADYGPLNDSRWTNPQIGYPIFLPKEHELTYEDRSQTTLVTGVQEVDSLWEVNVDLDPPTP